MSESEKRKKDDGANGSGGGAAQKKAREEEEKGAQTTVTDAEVDEFFAIIRRVHVAVKYFKDGNDDDVRKLMDLDQPLELDTENQTDGDGAKSRGSKHIGVEVAHAGLDLNADLGPDGEPA